MARHPIPRPTRLPSGSASAHPGRPSLQGGLPPLLLSLLHLRLKMYKTLLRINPGSGLLPPRPAAVAPPFIFARLRVSPSPRVARPPLLPARRPRRTWTSLSIRSPPRSRSPRLRTDLARGEEESAGERTIERGRAREREPESRGTEGVVTAFRSLDSCLSSEPAKGTLRLSMSQAARSQVPPSLQSPRRSRYASWTQGSPKFLPSRIKSVRPQLSAEDGH